MGKLIDTLPMILLPIIFTLIILQMAGIIDIRFSTLFGDNTITPGHCPTVSVPTCGSNETRDNMNIRVVAVLVPYNCSCPTDAQTLLVVDNTTPGGPYKMCKCDNAPE